MTTMRAMTIDKTGAPDVLVESHIERPERINSELLVRVVAAGVNPIDSKTRSGRGVSSAIASWPAVLGYDFSGIVVESPYEAHPLQPGSEVFGMTSVPRSGGSYAEFVAVSTLSVARKPRTVSHIEAAGIPLAALTAWGMVVDVAKAHEGQRMLIHAGAGGVGHFAVQLATYFGATVIATGSTESLGFLRTLGASEVIDYSTTRFDEVVGTVDAVIDLVGNVHDDTGTRSLTTLRPDGLIVNAPTGSWPTFAEDVAAAGVRGTTFKVAPDASTLSIITRLIDSGDVRVHVDSVFNLCDAAKAHTALDAGHTRGKIVLRISGE